MTTDPLISDTLHMRFFVRIGRNTGVSAGSESAGVVVLFLAAMWFLWWVLS